ncbi:hypothetical protein GVAV_000211 [Gurleya vavrai]
MPMLSNSSFDEIDHKFKTVLNRLGISQTKQQKLAHMLSPESKLVYIISLQSVTLKERNIVQYLEEMQDYSCISIINAYSLRATLKSGERCLYNVFKENNGVRIVQEIIYELINYNKECYSDINERLSGKVKKEKDSYNASDYLFPTYSRENLLEEHLYLIYIILDSYNDSLSDFNIYHIVKCVVLHKIYTKSFFLILNIYAKNSIENLEFLFSGLKENSHLCITKTYFYDIFKDSDQQVMKINYSECSLNNKDATKTEKSNESSNSFGPDIFNSSNISNNFPFNDDAKTKKRENAIDKFLIEKEIIQEFLSSKIYKNLVVYILKIIEINTPFLIKKMHEITVTEAKKNFDVETVEMNTKSIFFCEKTLDEDLSKEKENLKSKICLLVDAIENSVVIQIIPCFLENLVLKPEDIDKKKNEIQMKKEIENLKNEIKKLKEEGLKVNVKKDGLSEKLINEVSNEIDKNIVDAKIENPIVNVKVAIEKKIGSLNLNVRKGPPIKKFAAKKVVNELLVPYFKKKFNPIRWDKISKENNIWEEINKLYNLNELTNLMPIEEFLPFEKKDVIHSCVKRIVLKTVFQSKKGNAIEIALGRVKMSDEEFKNRIFNLNDSFFNENTLKQLILNFPSIDEMKMLNEIENGDKIGRAEEFFLHFCDCHIDFLNFLKIIYFKLTYINISNSIRENINKLTVIYKTGLESLAIKEFFLVALFLGNVFNGDSFSGNAEGFSLENIIRFIEYTGNNKERLIDYIKEKIKNNLKADLRIITSEQIKFDAVCTEMNEINKNFDQITIDKKGQTYLEILIKDYNKLKDDYAEFNALYERFVAYFKSNDIFYVFKMLIKAL